MLADSPVCTGDGLAGELGPPEVSDPQFNLTANLLIFSVWELDDQREGSGLAHGSYGVAGASRLSAANGVALRLAVESPLGTTR